jgi:hypothetical protein
MRQWVTKGSIETAQDVEQPERKNAARARAQVDIDRPDQCTVVNLWIDCLTTEDQDSMHQVCYGRWLFRAKMQKVVRIIGVARLGGHISEAKGQSHGL